MRLNNNTRHRYHMRPSIRSCKTRRRAGAPTTAYNQHGNINRVWVRKKTGLQHVTFVVDPAGTGTYCHATIIDKHDPTIKYHYGYEVHNPRKRDMGLHFWTTPYDKEYLLDYKTKNRLVKLFRELCDDDTIDRLSSIRLVSRKKSSKNSRRDNSRRSKRRRSRSRSISRSR